jgi:biopolymer transport protein ExbD
MASIDVGGGRGGRRAVDHDIPLIPFIDFLLCLVAFLLVTAVWSQMARLTADPMVPGRVGEERPPREHKTLHVKVRDDKFDLEWRRGQTLVSRSSIPRRSSRVEPRYADLAKRIAAEWKTEGEHRQPTDRGADHAVLHASNSLEFGELAAVLDALHAPKRKLMLADVSQEIPVFSVAFAAD